VWCGSGETPLRQVCIANEFFFNNFRCTLGNCTGKTHAAGPSST
jgi:hypothetical protein